MVICHNHVRLQEGIHGIRMTHWKTLGYLYLTTSRWANEPHFWLSGIFFCQLACVGNYWKFIAGDGHIPILIGVRLPYPIERPDLHWNGRWNIIARPWQFNHCTWAYIHHKSCFSGGTMRIYFNSTIQYTSIAMENEPCLDHLRLKHLPFSMAMLEYHRLSWLKTRTVHFISMYLVGRQKEKTVHWTLDMNWIWLCQVCNDEGIQEVVLPCSISWGLKYQGCSKLW